MRARVDFSLAEARRIALAAQALDAPRRASAKGAALLETVDRLGVLQIDAVNVLARAHYVPLYSRLGPYDQARLDDAAYGRSRSLFEYWGHQASLLPVSLQPLFRWRMERARSLEQIYGGLARFVRERRAYVDSVLEEVRERGALRAGELTSSVPRTGGWWGWSDAKRALEFLFWAGLVTTRSRKNFERIYDLTERVLPPEIVAAKTPSVVDAHRELVKISARALGIATDDDLADYFRLRLGDVRPRIAELVEERALAPVRIDGVAKPAYLAAGAKVPRSVTGRALLSPFDPLVWHRARTHRLFDFHYRIAIYTPEHLREHGYYVLPFLDGDALAARVDLKAAREESTLLVQAAHLEPGSNMTKTAASLAEELREVATWLGLERIKVTKRGTLAKALASEIRK
ncbi:MAG: hypothetical protein JWP87_5546 [Labilithrix sp.]|nr:hypothetical protein [Labilithrix sp.]